MTKAGAQVSLGDLAHAWVSCIKCNLGEERDTRRALQVFGNWRGTDRHNPDLRPVMFITDSPRRGDEMAAMNITWKPGQLFDTWLDSHRIQRAYVTSAVLCRPCVPYIVRETGEQKIDDRGEPVFLDTQPREVNTEACRSRLLAEIYTVDPVIIVPMGSWALQALMGKSPQKMEAEHGRLREVGIPGQGFVPKLTSRGAWLRKSKGTWHWPVERRKVLYPVLPLLGPHYILQEAGGDVRDGKEIPVNTQLLEKARDAITLLANLYHQLTE